MTTIPSEQHQSPLFTWTDASPWSSIMPRITTGKLSSPGDLPDR
ncbi:MAG: hypothetical protein PUI84_07120 [Bacteroidales bacterium]|nr:hypothetical protein [Bacteroidales bacterium]MDY3102014.1 hypothetical protein [Porphyromonas sp.]